MYIEVGEKRYELNTKLKTARQIESAFKLPINQLFSKLEEAEIRELIDLLAIAAGKADKESLPTFRKEIEESWDYSDIFLAVQEMITRLIFSGDAEQIERKLAKYPFDEKQKNVIRDQLGIPLVPISEPEDGTGVH